MPSTLHLSCCVGWSKTTRTTRISLKDTEGVKDPFSGGDLCCAGSQRPSAQHNSSMLYWALINTTPIEVNFASSGVNLRELAPREKGNINACICGSHMVPQGYTLCPHVTARAYIRPTYSEGIHMSTDGTCGICPLIQEAPCWGVGAQTTGTGEGAH